MRDDYKNNKYKFDEGDKWPPFQPTTVVNVALIHYKDRRTEQELIEISKRHKEGTPAIDKLAHHSSVTKDISKIFQTDFANSVETKVKPSKFILIEGAPGIGKTVLAKEIAYLWAKKKLLTNVDILFLLFLRDPELQNVKTLEQLIQYSLSKSLDKEKLNICVKQIMELQVGIVMDGFDEYPIKLRKKSFIANLIKGKVFHDSIVVITSRPTATINLHDKVDQRVEILGFAQEERDKYISDSLESPDQRKELQDYLKCQPIINGLIYVPLHLAVLLFLFKIQSKLPGTLTEMNESFIIHTIYRSLTKDELIPPATVTAFNSIKKLPTDISVIVKGLSKLAFTGLRNNQLVFSYNEIEENCPEIRKEIPGAFNGFGLLQVVQHFSKKGAGTTVSFNFLHFTMQEFLAAFHVANIDPHEQQLSLMEKTFWNSTYIFMWMMYVGIKGINSQTFMQFVYNVEPGVDIRKLKLSSNIQSDKMKCLHLFQCFMEAKSEEVPKEISNIFDNNEINFLGLRLLPHHISSLTLYISKYSMQIQSLNLRDCHIGDVGMSILEHYFTANPDKALTIKYIDLFGNNSVLLWNVYCAIFGQQNLTKLDWSSLGGVNIEEIINFIDNNMTCTVISLNLSDNHFNDDDAKRIAQVLSNNTTLQEFDFSKNNITTKGAIAISECLHNNVKLQHLKFSWNNHFINTDDSTINFSQRIINDTDAQIVTNILCKNETATKFDLSKNKISDKGAEGISKCIESNKTLTEIDISGNKISNIGLRKIAIALQINQTVLKLNISHNKISDDGAIAISEYLKKNNILQYLDISHNRLSNIGMTNISKALQINSTLQVLDISHNSISDDGVIAISETLRGHIYCKDNSMVTTNKGEVNIKNSTLRKLNISCNGITSKGIIALSDSLKNNNTLQELTISWNDHKTPFILDGTDKYFNMGCMYFGDVATRLKSAFLHQNDTTQKFNVSHHISDGGIVAISEYLRNNSKLQWLDISHNQVSNVGMIEIGKALQINTTLQILDISHNNISDGGAVAISEYLENNNTLQQLDVSHNQVSNVGMIKIGKALQIYTTLQILNISHNNISDDGAVAISEYLKNNNTLQQLDISHNQVSNVGMIKIGKALQIYTTLQILNISHNRISDDGAVVISKCLKKNNTLQQLDISHNRLCNITMINISKALQINSTLQVLDISHNSISDDGVIAISETLRGHIYCKDNSMVTTNKGEVNIKNSTLRKLNISCNGITSKGIIALSDSLKNNNTLQELTISWNDHKTPFILDGTDKYFNMGCMYFGDVATRLKSAFLHQNDTTQKFNVSHHISDGGIVAISEYLRNNSKLQWLDISHNQVSNVGMIEIGKALQINTALQILDISHNNISDDGTVAISEYLENNNTLQQLDISHNKVSNVGIIYIGKALQLNTTLQLLDISHNNISDGGAVAIGETLDLRSHIHCKDNSMVTTNEGATNEVNIKNPTLRILNISYNGITYGKPLWTKIRFLYVYE